MDSSKSTFEGAGHGQWRWPRTWPLNSRGLVCTAPEGAQSLPGSLSRVLLGSGTARISALVLERGGPPRETPGCVVRAGRTRAQRRALSLRSRVFSIRRAPHVSRCGRERAGGCALAWTCPGAERSACVSPRSESAVYSGTRDGTGRPRERPRGPSVLLANKK